MILAFDVEADTANVPDFGRRFYREALDRELLLRPMGNTVYFMPPYIITDDDAAFLAAGAAAALEAALK
jgi:adenosylmethionine-8-amino-7-oxononanoate aminotransferase